MAEQTFWWLVSMACVVWYSTITVYVAVRGGSEVRKMLARLKEDQATADQPLP